MGMSASQARLLALQARQSNLEYQGQQINQARSILSQQCTALYNSLLSMTVPTPPSTTDFQTIQYSGTQGSSKFTLGTVTPESGGTYNVEMKYERNGSAVKGGNYMEISSYDEPEFYYGVKVDENSYYAAEDVTYYEKGTEITDGTHNDNTQIMHSVTSPQDNVDTYYYIDAKSGGFVAAASFDDAKENATGNVYIKTTVKDIKEKEPNYNWNSQDNLDYVCGKQNTYTSGGITEAQFRNNEFYFADGTKVTLDKCTKKTGADGEPVYVLPEGAIQRTANGETPIKNTNYDPNEAQKVGTLGGNKVEAFSEETLGTYYEEAIKAVMNSYPEYKLMIDGEDDSAARKAIATDFKVVFKSNAAGDKIPYLVKTSEYDSKSQMSSANGQNRVEVFSLEPNGSYTENIAQKGCKLQFDSSGRITSIGVPIRDKDTNEIKGYEEITLEASTVTDDAAYKDAYAQYEYETYLYDQKNKEINAKTEIIQQEDRNLELKLQRLDNERTQITTEIEAVEKVINDNIESSYKTFSG